MTFEIMDDLQDDIILRIFEILGPRHAILTIGSANHKLRQLCQCDSLWRIFWLRRCCLFRHDSTLESTLELDDLMNSSKANRNGTVHRAALVFRHAIHSMNLRSKFLQQQQRQSSPSGAEGGGKTRTAATAADNYRSASSSSTALSSSLYEAYLQTHTLMKRTNLRPVAIKITSTAAATTTADSRKESYSYQLRQQLCTQTWPGQLSLLNHDRHRNLPNNDNSNYANNDNAATLVTCLNSANSWCDYPKCQKARCGIEGNCLRCYRFMMPSLPSITNNDYFDGVLLSFVKCDWCSVSFCNEHVAAVGDVAGSATTSSSQSSSWCKCDECNLSSCPTCVSQVFGTTSQKTPQVVCNVVTAGKKCDRVICLECIWFVGKEEGGGGGGLQHQQHQQQQIDYDSDDDDDHCNNSSAYAPKGINTPSPHQQQEQVIVSIRARDGGNNARRRIQQLKEKEMCCSKCLRHVEFRWRELSVVLDMFDGFVP